MQIFTLSYSDMDRGEGGKGEGRWGREDGEGGRGGGGGGRRGMGKGNGTERREGKIPGRTFTRGGGGRGAIDHMNIRLYINRVIHTDRQTDRNTDGI